MGVAVLIAVVIVGGAAFALTQDFKTGHNRVVDYGQAVNGDSEAQYRQALKLQHSNVLGDSDKAEAWFEKAANGGNVKAMMALGDIHNAGASEADGDQAVSWYEKAARAGNFEAMRKLGIAYSIGRGRMDPDPTKALPLFEAAAKGGDVVAQRLYGEALLARLKFDEGESWLIKAADNGDVPAAAILGNAYYGGVKPMKDLDKAVIWLGKAAEGGDTASQLTYSYMYYDGHGVKKDGAEAYKWLDIAGDSGKPDVRSAMAFLVDRISDEEIAEGKRRAAEWRKSHKA
ncbi:MAG: sel1 repeat family protein [Asticcacaulis sp.]|nr:sel1 repeat family protein [Asticcacaulis sp.]